MIAFACRQCGKRFDRPEHTAGTMIFCDCGIGNTVPFESTLPPLPPSVPAIGSPWGERPARAAAVEGSHDPAMCFNHPTLPVSQPCADCQLPFCADCTLSLQGAILCGPCKNLRLRRLDQSPRLSVMAIFSPLIALGAGVFWGLVMLVSLGAGSKSALPTLGAIGVLPQIVALTMGALSLHTIETGRNVSGREWAMTGLVASVVCGALMVVLGLAVPA